MHSLDEILTRKARLCSDISRQRDHLAGSVHALQPLFSGADRALAMGRSLRAHPAWVATGLGVLLALLMRRKPKKRKSESDNTALALRWLRRGLFAWRTGTWAWGLVKDASQVVANRRHGGALVGERRAS